MDYKCPLCENRIEYTSNDAMIDSGWWWVSLDGADRIICDECFKERRTLNRDIMEIVSTRQYNRRGVTVSERST